VIGLSLQQDSRVRSNTARFLALFLAFSVLSHGLYYSEEWLIFGFAISLYVMVSHLFGRFKVGKATYLTLGLTDSLLVGMLGFSVLGVLHPVKAANGLQEALQWGIFWLVYRLGMRISSDETAKKKLLSYIEWLAMVVAIIGWLPWVGQVAGRLSSVFGYPNTMAAFLGAVLLLNPRRKLVRILLGTSLLATGSRAGVGLFVVIFIGQLLLIGARSQNISPYFKARQAVPRLKKRLGSANYLSGLWVIVLSVSGLVLIMLMNGAAWDNLTTWSFSSSSWQERQVYFKDGIRLAWNARGLPQAGGWLAFPTVQQFPYWTADPHSSFIHILLNQGVLGILSVGIWSCLTLAQTWRTWRKKRMLHKAGAESQETKAQVRVWAALLFLALHSLVDADFSFGTLGVLFWLLLGSFQKTETYHRSFYSKRNMAVNMSNKIMLLMSAILCLVSASILLNPALIEKERTWNALADHWSEQDSEKSIALWDKSLNWDQTQSNTRQKQAEHLLRQGNGLAGLEAVEEVLKWQPYNIEAYEWAQSVIWDAAEVQRHTHPETANRLYRWVEGVPKTIEEKVQGLSSKERLLWKGHPDFLPSPHIMLLAEYARQRQLTQPLFIT